MAQIISEEILVETVIYHLDKSRIVKFEIYRVETSGQALLSKMEHVARPFMQAQIHAHSAVGLDPVTTWVPTKLIAEERDNTIDQLKVKIRYAIQSM